jgi:hypothetical protein
MIQFVKGIFFDQRIRCSKMLENLSPDELHTEIEPAFLEKTIEMLVKLRADIQALIDSED